MLIIPSGVERVAADTDFNVVHDEAMQIIRVAMKSTSSPRSLLRGAHGGYRMGLRMEQSVIQVIADRSGVDEA